jgi:hypothetical protein
VKRHFPAMAAPSNQKSEPRPMSRYVLNAFFWILGIRGHIPQSVDVAPLPGQSSFRISTGTVIRALTAFVVMVALLSLALWLLVWLAIKLL